MPDRFRKLTVGRGSAILFNLLLMACLALAPASAATTSQLGSGWSVNNNADWTPFPPATNPLGPPDDLCVDASAPVASWAEFTFPAFAIPPGDTLLGIEVRTHYRTSVTHTIQLTNGGSLVGSTRTMPDYFVGQSFCSSTNWVSTGGAADLWGAGLTIANFNAGTVGFRITKNGATIALDAVEIIVHHGAANSPPTAEAGGPYAVAEGGSVGLSGAGSSDPDQATGTLTFEWDLDNNGSYETPGISPVFSAAGTDGPASATVGLRVTDDGALSDTDTATINISNVAPSVGPPVTAPEPSDEGGAAVASATFSDPGTGETYTCTVDYGDGSGPLAGSAVGGTCTGPAHVYGDNGIYVVTVTVSDDDGGSGGNASNHGVDNVAPTVSTPVVAPEPSDEGELAVASADFTDPGADDSPFTCTVDYGEGDGPVAGTVAGTTCTGPGHVYGDNGSYTVTVAVTDKDGDTGTESSSHQVDNVPPTVASPVVTPEPSDEGDPVTASATFTDPGIDDSPFTCTVDYGDGVGPVAGSVSAMTCTGPSHTYADNGDYSVTVEVTDKDGGAGAESSDHQVDNVPPTIAGTTNSAEECGDTPEGAPVDVAADFSDPGFDNPVAGTLEDFTDSTIDWGDGTVDFATITETPGSAGTPTTGTASGSHVYVGGGIFTVTITVTDDDGGTDSTSVTAFVTGAGLNAGELQVVGTNAKDVINIQEKKGDIEVMAGFLQPKKQRFAVSDVVSLQVAACDGDDQVHVNHDVLVPAILDGGGGRDHVRAGSGLSLLLGGDGDDQLFAGDSGDLVEGGQGDDVIQGGTGHDILLGQLGDDHLFGHQGDDLLDGGAGVDLCQPGPGTDTVVNCEP